MYLYVFSHFCWVTFTFLWSDKNSDRQLFTTCIVNEIQNTIWFLDMTDFVLKDVVQFVLRCLMNFVLKCQMNFVLKCLIKFVLKKASITFFSWTREKTFHCREIRAFTRTKPIRTIDKISARFNKKVKKNPKFYSLI